MLSGDSLSLSPTHTHAGSLSPHGRGLHAGGHKDPVRIVWRRHHVHDAGRAGQPGSLAPSDPPNSAFPVGQHEHPSPWVAHVHGAWDSAGRIAAPDVNIRHDPAFSRPIGDACMTSPVTLFDAKVMAPPCFLGRLELM